MTDDVKQRLAAAKAARMNDPEWREKELARNRERKKRLSPEQAEKKRIRDRLYRDSDEYRAIHRERQRQKAIAKAGGIEAIEARKREREERAAARLSERQAMAQERKIRAAELKAERIKLSESMKAETRAETLIRMRRCSAAYYKKRKEEIKAYRSDYKKANRDRLLIDKRHYNHTRRARKAATTSPATKAEIASMMVKATHCCYCGCRFTKAIPKTIDHIVPFAKGGSHSVDNLAICCRHCNSTKQAKAPDEWAKEVGMLFVA